MDFRKGFAFVLPRELLAELVFVELDLLPAGVADGFAEDEDGKFAGLNEAVLAPELKTLFGNFLNSPCAALARDELPDGFEVFTSAGNGTIGRRVDEAVCDDGVFKVHQCRRLHFFPLPGTNSDGFNVDDLHWRKFLR